MDWKSILPIAIPLALDWIWDKISTKKAKKNAKEETKKLETKIKTALNELGASGERIVKKLEEYEVPTPIKSEVTGAWARVGRALKITNPPQHDESEGTKP